MPFVTFRWRIEPKDGDARRFHCGWKYTGVANGGILHTLNYSINASGATMYGPRVTLNLLGDGYIEAVSDGELQGIAREEAATSQGKVHGELVYLTPDASRGNARVVGRFGWKAQHAGLVDASADALFNELGVPNRIFHGISSKSGKAKLAPNDRPSAGRDELDELVAFIRHTEPVAPDPARSATKGVQAGSKIFDRVGCSICHVRTSHDSSAWNSHQEYRRRR